VIVRFVDFQSFLKVTDDFSEKAMQPAAYDPQQVDDFARVEATREALQWKFDPLFVADEMFPADEVHNFDNFYSAYLDAPSLNEPSSNWPGALDMTARIGQPAPLYHLSVIPNAYPHALIPYEPSTLLNEAPEQIDVVRHKLAEAEKTIKRLRDDKSRSDAENRRLREALICTLQQGDVDSLPPKKGDLIPIGTQQQSFGLWR
jgi:hypothetical protein